MSDFDDLAEAARRRSRTDYAHIDIQMSEYGVSIVARDEEPFMTLDEEGEDYTVTPGSVITVGFGPDIATALSTALSNIPTTK